MTSQDPSRVHRTPEFSYSSPPRAIERAMKTSTEDVHVAVNRGGMHNSSRDAAFDDGAFDERPRPRARRVRKTCLKRCSP